MASKFGTTLNVSVFGQSHSPSIGCVIEGLPSGFSPDWEKLQKFMARRAPGQGKHTTPRKEPDIPEVISGLNPDGKTCGAPLCAIIHNTNTRSRDYNNLVGVPRPGHSDFPAWAKWHGNNDIPGGGHFSGRLTAPITFAGAIAKQMLEEKGVRIAAHLKECAGIEDEAFDCIDNSLEAQARLSAQMDALEDGRTFPAINKEVGEAMFEAIDQARRDQDSVGGIIECVATGMPAGIGAPMFDGIENVIARAAFGIPACKGIEFGSGFNAPRKRGSQNNDPYTVCDGKVVPTTNNAGGATGGITTGAPVVFRLAMKPTSSIGVEQDSVDLETLEPVKLNVRGRHDPCVATRAVPVAEAICALSLLDAWLSFPAEPTYLGTLTGTPTDEA